MPVYPEPPARSEPEKSDCRGRCRGRATERQTVKNSKALYLILGSLLTAPACGGGGESSPDAGSGTVDPLGNWTMTVNFAADDCGNPASSVAQTIGVVKTSSGYGLVASGDAATGTMTCTASTCTLAAVLTFTDSGANHQINENLTLMANGKISGGGTGSASNTTQTCTASFTAVGVLVR